MKKRNIIIDCDPGHDDVIAILMAIAHKNLFNILGITTVGGNQTLEKVTKNALKVLTIANENIKVVKGAKGPLLGDLVTAEDTHGDSGMDGPIIEELKYDVYSENAIQFMYESLIKSKEKITIVGIGPLTNIALLISSYPEIKEKIELISIMGGGIESGNVTPSAEFNIYVDPESAKIVFNSGIPIVMSGVDVTKKSYISEKEVNELGKRGKASKFVKELLNFYCDSGKRLGFKVSVLHDPCAIAYLIDPTIFGGRDLHIEIETKGEVTRGMTIADLRATPKHKPNAKVLFDVDRERFVNLIYRSLEILDEKLK